MIWLTKILDQEKASLLAFFGKEFDLTDFEKTLLKYGEKQIHEWKKILLEPHFLPKVEMKRKADFPGWKIRPDDHSYEVVYQGKVLRVINGELQPDKKAHWLSGETVLIDIRLKPAYQDGKQMWEGDEKFLGKIISSLRESGKINRYEYGPQSSRFSVSADEWETQVKQALNQTTNLIWRLERAIEAHVIPQLYPYMPRYKNGQTNTWVWYEEYFEDRSGRVFGGYSDFGGLANFSWDSSGGRWGGQSFCPLAVL